MTSHRSPAGARALLASLAGILCLAALLSAVLSQAAGNDSPAPGLSQEETLRLGERIYRDGILSSGEPLTAVVQGDIPVEGTMFSCVSCHLRSGLGSFEGGVLTPPTNGNVLYKPWNSSRETAKLRKGSMEGSAKLWTRSWYYLSRFGEFPNRPAYTDETLSDAILEGVDPEGRRFLGVMPRYPLDKRDMAILIAYLKSLSAVPSPGVTETTIRFATVVTEEVSGAERDAMLGPLERYLRSFNARALREAGKRKGPAGEGGVSRIAADPDLRQMSLARWELKGSPETWRGQLEEYYRKEPVFALLGGITTKEWRPIHEFSEDHAVPCLFPVTDLPFVSNGWYTLYFSKGYYQEGETAARHLAREEDPDNEGDPGSSRAGDRQGAARRSRPLDGCGGPDAAGRGGGQGRRHFDDLPVGDPSQGRAPDRAGDAERQDVHHVSLRAARVRHGDDGPSAGREKASPGNHRPEDRRQGGLSLLRPDRGLHGVAIQFPPGLYVRHHRREHAHGILPVRAHKFRAGPAVRLQGVLHRPAFERRNARTCEKKRLGCPLMLLEGVPHSRMQRAPWGTPPINARRAR
ncbi:MAG: cytochrome [Deltaproteobacteria bacterium]|nr:cytochrome [Deltaproteobacteria bacterium]